MPDQTARQRARRTALDVQTRMRQARAEQDRRRSALAVTVVTALTERDALVRSCEGRAGEALRALTEDEGLTLREAVQWCGGEGQVSVREATRLRRLAADGGVAETERLSRAGEGERPSAVVEGGAVQDADVSTARVVRS